MQEINLQIFHFFNNLSSNSQVELFVKCFVDTPIFIIPLFLAWYWLYYTYNPLLTSPQGRGIAQKNNLLFIFYWTALALIISLIIQQFVSVDRPEEHLQAGGKLLLDHLPDASFPSDHATVSIAFLAWIFFAWYRKWWCALLLPFIFMNISRIIAWVHWPFDVIAGSIVWITGAYITFSHLSQIKFVKKLNSKIIELLHIIKL